MDWDKIHQHLTTQISKTDIKVLPEYTVGKRDIVFVGSNDVDNVIKEIAKSNIIGFDTESRPTFKKDDFSGISLIQIATTDACYLFHETKVQGKFSALKPILESDDITKVGTGLKSDKSMLQQHYDIQARSLLDTANIFSTLGKHNGMDTGAKQMVAVVLNKQLRKSKKSCTSNWSKLPFRQGQIKYASEDATAPFDCYQNLLDLFRKHHDRLPNKLKEVIQYNI